MRKSNKEYLRGEWKIRMEGEAEPVPAAPLLPSDVKYDEKKMLLHKLDR